MTRLLCVLFDHRFTGERIEARGWHARRCIWCGVPKWWTS